ncbi:hypothetical protein HYX18_03560 [Candidatus Woesearchaeota archaeon]|nr:hypothetical protein [Candidatus Woesearchaeota archaeon]
MVEFNFEEKVKNSFIKAKKDIFKLENEIKEIKNLLIKQQEQIDLILSKIDKNYYFKSNEDNINHISFDISTGNEGVRASERASERATAHIKPKEKDQIKANFDSISIIDNLFRTLTKREFLLFLTIYQLEDDMGNVTYDDISKHLKLSEGRIRSHIVTLLRKGLPVIINKINNRIAILSISPEFRELGLKTRLINLYNNQDPYQKKLV